MDKLEALRAYMEQNGVEGVLLANPSNVTWLTGFSGDSAEVLVTMHHAYLVTDSRYTEQAEQEAGERFSIEETTAAERLAYLDGLMSKRKIRTLAIERSYVTLQLFEDFEKSWFIRYADIDGAMRQLRAIKTPEDLERMRRGAKITEDAFEHLLKYIKPGVSERELYAVLIYFMNKAGVEPSFRPILASGENSAMPHAPITERKLEPGDLLTMDFGVKLEGQCTDFTRTVAISGLEQKLQVVYNTVKLAQEAALAAVRAEQECSEVDEAARSFIENAGYGKYFGHSTGHGVGVDIHEAPTVSKTSQDMLKENMVITIEPGIYLPKKGGVRIEDFVAVTENGCENFYTATKELIIV